MGVSVENADCLHRIDDLRACGAAVKFLSLEPLLGPLPGLDLRGIHWVIVGGESGPGARECRVEWIADIVRQCRAAGVACFVKQLGAQPRIKCGHPLPLADKKGGDPGEWPAGDWPREFPR